jgi:hypothetical protein
VSGRKVTENNSIRYRICDIENEVLGFPAAVLKTGDFKEILENLVSRLKAAADAGPQRHRSKR